jgi:hypothetical protein
VFLLYKCAYTVVMETTTAITATRTIKNGKATVTVAFPDGTTFSRAGKIAERATCAMVSIDQSNGQWFVFGFRADLEAAIAQTINSGNPNFQAIVITEA